MQDSVSPQTSQGSGYERPTLRQFNIFLENRVGRLNTLLRCLEEGGQRVNAVNIEESSDAALVRMICGNPDVGRQCLKDAGFSFSESDVIAVELPPESDFPLIKICRHLLAAEINVHYAYPMLYSRRGPAIILYLDDRTLAIQILIRKGFTLIGESDLR